MERTEHQVVSKDGTTIAYDRQGDGPAVVLVGGALVDPATGRAGRWENAPLAADLAGQFTVVNYDRRGREDSGDTLPHSLEREIEDLDAIVTAAGGSAHLYGVSTGGALALEAAAAGLAIDCVGVYEVPYFLGEAAQWWLQYVEELTALLAEDRRGDAVELFMRTAGASEENIAGARSSSMWPGLEAVAHTLAYDAACLGDGHPPAERLGRLSPPVLVLTGEPSGAPGDIFGPAADAIAALVPQAERRILAGQTHVASPDAVVPVLAEFFKR